MDSGLRSASNDEMVKMLKEVRALLAHLKEHGVEATAVYVATEAEKQQRRLEQSRKNARL